MDQKYHTTINGMSNEQMLSVMQAYGFNREAWSNLRESLRLKLMFDDIPTEALENYMNEAFKEGQRVRVIVSSPIIGKIGTVIRNTGTVNLFWVVRLDGETYDSDDTGTLLNPSEIETLY